MKSMRKSAMPPARTNGQPALSSRPRPSRATLQRPRQPAQRADQGQLQHGEVQEVERQGADPAGPQDEVQERGLQVQQHPLGVVQLPAVAQPRQQAVLEDLFVGGVAGQQVGALVVVGRVGPDDLAAEELVEEAELRHQAQDDGGPAEGVAAPADAVGRARDCSGAAIFSPRLGSVAGRRPRSVRERAAWYSHGPGECQVGGEIGAGCSAAE